MAETSLLQREVRRVLVECHEVKSVWQKVSGSQAVIDTGQHNAFG